MIVIKHLKDREYYEDLYDHITVDIGRREAGALLEARENFYANTEVSDEDKKAFEFWWERMYWWLVELPYLLPRWENRTASINELMATDRQLDERLENARPRIESGCSSCGKQGLRLALKYLLRKEGNDERSVLFMFDCPACEKRSAYWEDGSELVSEPTPCPNCGSPLRTDIKTTKKFMTTTVSCSQCDHKTVEKVDITKPRDQEEGPDADPDFERFKEVFCLSDERARTMQAYRPKWEEGMRMLDEEMAKDADKEIYEAVAKIEQLKIPQLIEQLRPAVEAAGYIEVTFDKPELGVYVTLDFSCMDSDSNREDSRSRKMLKKAVNMALENTNWRLMSDGISYRLGYLSGRVRAYENEKDLAELLRSDKS